VQHNCARYRGRIGIGACSILSGAWETRKEWESGVERSAKAADARGRRKDASIDVSQ